MRCQIIALVALLFMSCGVSPGDFGVEAIEVIDDSNLEEMVVKLTLRNDSQRDVTLREAEIVAELKREALISFILIDTLRVAPQGVTQVESRWRVRRDDPASLYALRRRPIEQYMDRLTFGYDISLSGVGRNTKQLSGKGVKAKKLNINFENLLR
ncbi:MAG: hypothetical protein R3Y20_05405 [Rikenellaceae bacterium]